jgi:chromosome segregation ATPase
MSWFENVIAAYTRGEPAKTYRERRWSILQLLHQMTPRQLQHEIDELNGDVAALKEENARLKTALRQKKQQGRCEIYLDGVHRVMESSGPLQLRYSANKQAIKWIQREKRIYVWELRLRKVKSVKLPALRLKQQGLEKRLEELKQEIKAAEEKLTSLRSEYGKAESELAETQHEIGLLSE